MLIRTLLAPLSWTLINQAVVSLGTFAVNVGLARGLPQADYGSFAVIFGSLLLLQVFNAALVFHPLTIRMATSRANRDEVLIASVSLMAAVTVPLLMVTSAALMVFGHPELIVPTLLWFLIWQCQETLRRILFAEFRHRAAIFGDSLSYLGSAVAIALLSHAGLLTLPRAMLVLAGAYGVAVLVQYFQVAVRWRRPMNLRVMVSEYWSVGRWPLGSSLATALRLNGLLWLILLITSRSDVAQFQAAGNVANVVNPILFGLCNIVPQTAARVLDEGIDKAWRISMQYASLGFVPIIGYQAFVIASPDFALRILYGTGSAYVDAAFGVQILASAFLMNYGCEMICAYMYGVNAGRNVFGVNLAGNLGLALFAVPLVWIFGWVGGCLAMAGANAVRLLLAALFLRGLVPRHFATSEA
jgi:O-antigen/teichoic acid export membrane protein